MEEGLKDSIDKLTAAVENLFNLFKKTSVTLEQEKNTQSESLKLQPLMEKIDRLDDENNKIAKGIVALADMVEELKGLAALPNKPAQPIQQPQPIQPQGPPPMSSKPLPQMGPQPQPDKKKGFFHR